MGKFKRRRRERATCTMKLSEYKKESVDMLGESPSLTALQRRTMRRTLSAKHRGEEGNLPPLEENKKVNIVSPPGLRYYDSYQLPKTRRGFSRRYSKTRRYSELDAYSIEKGSHNLNRSLKNLDDDKKAGRNFDGIRNASVSTKSTTAPPSSRSSCTSRLSRTSVTSTQWFRDAAYGKKPCSYNYTSVQTLGGTMTNGSDIGRRESTISVQSHIMSECWFRFFFCLFFLICYLLLGAGVYSRLESEEHMKEKNDLVEFWRKFQKENNISKDVMERFLKSHYHSCQHGDKGISGNQWDFPSALFFSGTVITTIGYGHATPQTYYGKLFTVIYAYFGIPMMLGLLNVVAEMLLALLRLIKAKIKKVEKIFHLEVFLSANVASLIVSGIMIIMYTYQESEWSNIDSFYFAFVTMTTIGFGDFVPGQFNSTADSDQDMFQLRGTVYEFLNLFAYLFAVVVWYFQAHVTAQILKSKTRFLYSIYLIKVRKKGDELSDNEQGVQSESSEESEPPPIINKLRSFKRRASVAGGICTCSCICGATGPPSLPKPPINGTPFDHQKTNGGIRTSPMHFVELNNRLNSLHEESIASSNSSSCNPVSPDPASQLTSPFHHSSVEQTSRTNSIVQDKSLSRQLVIPLIASSSVDFDRTSELLVTRLYSPVRPSDSSKSFNTRLTKSLGDVTVVSDPALNLNFNKSVDSFGKDGAKSNKPHINKPSLTDLASESAEFSGFQRPFEELEL